MTWTLEDPVAAQLFRNMEQAFEELQRSKQKYADYIGDPGNVSAVTLTPDNWEPIARIRRIVPGWSDDCIRKYAVHHGLSRKRYGNRGRLLFNLPKFKACLADEAAT